MTGYLIKGTYLTGNHEGQSYFLRKGGFVTDLDSIQWEDTVYKTESVCKQVCSRMMSRNSAEHEGEKKERECKQARGFQVSSYMIHELVRYEPFRVEDVVS